MFIDYLYNNTIGIMVTSAFLNATAVFVLKELSCYADAVCAAGEGAYVYLGEGIFTGTEG